MVFGFTRGKWCFAAAIFVAPALAFGYYAGDPGNLGITVNATLSGAGSVHGRYISQSEAKTARLVIGREAIHLFSAPQKGPRADRYVFLTRSNKGFDPDVRTAAVSGIKADMIVTRALSNMAALAPGEVAQITSAPSFDEQAPGFGALSVIPVAQRTSASLFLSSLNRTPMHFPEFEDQQVALDQAGVLRSSKISRGLKFKGETENEYQVRQRRCLATAIYFEARGESTRGQLAVAQVVMNRVRSTLYPDTICGVVYQGQLRRTGCQFSFTCDGRTDIPRDKGKWQQANLLAKRVTEGDSWLSDIGYATHYHASYVKPRWRREMSRIKKVGKHIFYRVKTEQIKDVLNEKKPVRVKDKQIVKDEQIKDVLSEENPVRGLAFSGNG